MKYTKRIQLLLMITGSSIIANAQTAPIADSTKIDSIPAKKNVFTASLNYVNRLNYFGRVDSLKSSGIFPILGIESKIGLYATGTFIFTQNTVQPLSYAGTSVEAGYKFPESKNFGGNLAYTQFLYKNTADIVQSALKSQVAVNATWKNKFVNVTGGAELRFSDKTDIGITGAVDHLFIFKLTGIKKSAVALDPTATVNAGSQKFVQSYSRRTGGIFGELPGGTTTENVNRFSLLSYEFSMPAVLVINKFFVALTPAYVIPQNLVTVRNKPEMSETGSNMFYFTATVGTRLEFR